MILLLKVLKVKVKIQIQYRLLYEFNRILYIIFVTSYLEFSRPDCSTPTVWYVYYRLYGMFTSNEIIMESAVMQ